MTITSCPVTKHSTQECLEHVGLTTQMQAGKLDHADIGVDGPAQRIRLDVPSKNGIPDMETHIQKPVKESYPSPGCGRLGQHGETTPAQGRGCGLSRKRVDCALLINQSQ